MQTQSATGRKGIVTLYKGNVQFACIRRYCFRIICKIKIAGCAVDNITIDNLDGLD